MTEYTGARRGALLTGMVPRPLMRLLRFWGVDRAIGYTLIGRGLSVITGPITLLLIASYLTPAEQGYYFTFGNIIGLQIFFELGLGGVISQFASHEKARLDWTPEGTLEGDEASKSRLASLLFKSMLWYGVAAALVVAVVLPLGAVFFARQEQGGSVNWLAPWMWIVLASAGSLLLVPIISVLYGCGLVSKIASLQVCQSLGGSLLLWLALALGGKLMAAPVMSTFGLVCGAAWLVLRQRGFLRDLAKRARAAGGEVSWRREVWPFQWRIALSWLSGYFIFQLFNPVMFAYHGPAAAGQMGMSLSIMASISAIAIAWVATKAPSFGTLIAKGEYQALDRLFFRCVWQSVALIVLGGAAFWFGTLLLRGVGHPLGQRLLPPLPLSLLVAASIVNYIVYAEAVYLRAHKQEPFLWISLASGGLIGASTYLLGKEFGAIGVMAGYLAVSTLVGLGAGTWVFFSKRRLWHSVPAPELSPANSPIPGSLS